jgi:arylsulfatase A-like enzyme
MGQRYGKDVLAHFRGEPDRGGDKNFPPYVAVVQDEFKLVHYLRKEHGEELYDLRNDQDELQNLIKKTEHAELIQKLRGVLKSELQRTEAPFELN